MKTFGTYRIFLIVLVFSFTAFIILPMVHASETAKSPIDIEVGIYYGMSVIIPYGEAQGIIIGQMPSGTIDLGTGVATFYTMFFFCLNVS